MTSSSRQLLAIESPFPEQNCMLRFLEPPERCKQSLWDSLFDGTYGKPFIVDSGMQRFLHFDLDAIQSVMHLEQPNRLCLAYTRKMMAFLLFNQTPARILMLGLGGGSLAKFCYRRLPATALTAVEANPDVIALREEFRIPPDDARFRVIRANGADYVARLRPCKDVILADACDRNGIAPELDAIEFYHNAHHSLRRGGVFISNLCGNALSRLAHLTKIRSVFGGTIITLRVRPDANVVVFAFKEHRPKLEGEQIEARARELQRQFGLNFPAYVRRIALEQKGRGRNETPTRARASNAPSHQNLNMEN